MHTCTENRDRISTTFCKLTSCQDTNKGNISHPLTSSCHILFLCLHPWWGVTTCDSAVVFHVPPVWTTMSSGACPPMPQRSRRLSARSFLHWKSPMQREPPFGLAGIQGRLEGLASRQGARQLNGHNWNSTCFLTQYCDKSLPCLFMSDLHGLPVLPTGFPRTGWVLLLIAHSAGRGLVLHSLCACLSQGSVTELVRWSGWFRKQNIATTGICLCLRLAQPWGNSTSLIFSSLHLIFNAFFTSCPAPSLSKPLLFYFWRNSINHTLNSKGIFLIPVYSPFSLPKVIMKIMEMLEVQRVNQRTMLMLQESFITGRGKKPTALETGRRTGMNSHLSSQIFPSGML